ncbi:GNAT family N-acetyltransferase [Marinobacterium arenosum]|uniref:GNAT family N-acetyltransferase n=1 Tax=Marinobacterium arenosum TaxID=2862496 RepID=UPI001C94F6E4|nr:GNAT family N-acetyltransferase [Marinobacterium arenosum]MBY4675305.1 GNAT family N-acetyltransferase [Marinobacterium arenosum]
MLNIHVHHSLDEIDAHCWNALCGTDYPFLRHEFLQALEQSGSVCAETGWQPLHLRLEQDGSTVAVMPLYLKSHSYGEYVFDWAWADAYQQHGLDYYPKLVTAIPFTPAWGPRLGSRLPDAELMPLLAQGLKTLAERTGASSWHGLFPSPAQQQAWVAEGLLPRLGCQYHWFNEDYRSFDDFLAHCSSRKRKNLRKERQKIVRHGVKLRRLSGEQISDAQLAQFYRFYQLTYLKRGRRGYLTAEFFQLLRERMPQQLLLVLAEYQDQPVAGALSLRSSDTLYGRYWGCLDEFDSLHFETCYYQGIEYCIEQGLKRFDPGAQGEHKIQRGFRPIETWSCHWIREPGFRAAIEQYLAEEAALVREQIEELSELLPFRKE